MPEIVMGQKGEHSGCANWTVDAVDRIRQIMSRVQLSANARPGWADRVTDGQLASLVRRRAHLETEAASEPKSNP